MNTLQAGFFAKPACNCVSAAFIEIRNLSTPQPASVASRLLATDIMHAQVEAGWTIATSVRQPD
jgi:hypothetical protein